MPCTSTASAARSAAVERAIGALDSQADGALQHGDDRAQGRVGILQLALHAADAAQKLVGLGGLARIPDQHGGRRGIVGRHVDALPGSDLLEIGIDLLLGLLQWQPAGRKADWDLRAWKFIRKSSC